MAARRSTRTLGLVVLLRASWTACFSGLFFVPVSVLAASFYCSGPLKNVERLICSSAELSSLDDILAEAYSAAKTRSSAPQRLVGEQRQWLTKRDTCSDHECVRATYETRIMELAANLRVNSTSAIPDVDAAVGVCARTTANSPEYSFCLGRLSEAFDKRVDTEYRAVLKRLSHKPEQQRRIQDDQNNWLTNREHECREIAEEVQGTGMGIAYSSCLISRASERLQKLVAP